MYFGVTSAWGAGHLAKADALVRQAIVGFRSDGDAMGLGLRNVRRRAPDDGISTKPSGSPPKPSSSSERPAHRSASPSAVEGRGTPSCIIRDELADVATFVAEAVEIFSSYGNLGCSA